MTTARVSPWWRSVGRHAALLLFALGATACASGESSPLDDGRGALPDTLPITAARAVDTLGAFEDRDIDESSAAVRSWVTPGIFWTLNDSGNNERLFAFDSTGRDLGAVSIRRADNRDWEAMAAGPCPEGRCLYVGDVGDNFERHQSVTVWRLPEPVPPGQGPKVPVDAVPLRFRYADGPRDVEAMWVDADTVTWFATKRRARDTRGQNRPSLVYRLPAAAWRTDGVATAELVDSLPMIIPTAKERFLVTDASLANPFGASGVDSLLVVRTYELLYVFRVHGTSGRPGELVAACDLTALDQDQGEGVTWLADGRLLLTSEKKAATLQATRCP